MYSLISTPGAARRRGYLPAAGGSPYFYTWYRWAYGWGYDRKYQALIALESERAEALFAEYLAGEPAGVCRN